jgi:hypothetical protein
MDGQGVFTTALIAALRASPASVLLALPLRLQAWRDALPRDLLASAAAPVLEPARNLGILRSQPPSAHQTIALIQGRVPQ